MKIADLFKTLFAPILNVFAFNLQDTIKQAVNRLVRSLMNDGFEQQANEIVQSSRMMEFCAMVDTFIGCLIFLLTLFTTVGFFMVNWRTIKLMTAKIQSSLIALKKKWIPSTKRRLED